MCKDSARRAKCKTNLFDFAFPWQPSELRRPQNLRNKLATLGRI
nr:MAG TPA: hypothetical protein [Crassvirales sp.]